MKYLILASTLLMVGCSPQYVPSGMGDECVKRGWIPVYRSTLSIITFTCVIPETK